VSHTGWVIISIFSTLDISCNISRLLLAYFFSISLFIFKCVDYTSFFTK
jgi:hypothetical protein